MASELYIPMLGTLDSPLTRIGRGTFCIGEQKQKVVQTFRTDCQGWVSGSETGNFLERCKTSKKDLFANFHNFSLRQFSFTLKTYQLSGSEPFWRITHIGVFEKPNYP